MASNSIILTTRLEGFIRVDEPGGKFNNCSFSFRIPEKDLPFFDAEYDNALTWGRENYKGKKRLEEAAPPWDEDGVIRYNFGGDASKPFFVFVDRDGDPFDLESLGRVGEGTKVRLSVACKPYIFANKIGISITVRGGLILDLVQFGQEAIDEEAVVSDLLAFGDDDEEEKPVKQKTSKARKAPTHEEIDEDDVPF